ncbi:MAG: phosphoglycerate dehydrogenase [Gammaproteobacteria bacterium]|nr:MAG: phosphoglycerate dehydrogenase [Gammaproteobacteria bacterium]
MYRVLVTDRLAEEGLEILRAQTSIEVEVATGLSEEELIGRIGDYDALLIRSGTQVTAPVLEAGRPRLKVVGRAGIGVDNVDLEAATELGVIVMNTPDANAVTTAELALAHLFSVSRHLPQADRSVREGRWERGRFMGNEISGKTLGVVGFGTIGRIVAERALGLKMEVLAHDPFVTAEVFERHGVRGAGLDELFTAADYVTLHTPLNDHTRELVNAERLALMKPGAFLINCARGGLVDDQALAEALREGRLAGAALDVFQNEPPTGSPLLELENCLFTPHLGASTREAQVAVSVNLARQVATFLESGEAVNALNLPRLSADELRRMRPWLDLAGALGRLLAHLSPAPLQQLEVTACGQAAELDLGALSAEALVGLLGEALSIPVNRVNVTRLARRQGIAVTEARSEDSPDYHGLLRLEGRAGEHSVAVAGTLLGGAHPRLVAIDDYEVEAVPEGCLLITRHEDRPGVVAALGTLLGEARINISRMQVGTAEGREEAIALIGISRPLEAQELEQVAAIPAVHTACQVEL